MAHNCPEDKSLIYQGKIIIGCEECLPKLIQAGDSAKFYRDAQKAEYRREITQPTDGRAFSKAYPDIARERYGDDNFRILS